MKRRIIRLPEVLETTGLSKSLVFALQTRGTLAEVVEALPDERRPCGRFRASLVVVSSAIGPGRYVSNDE